MLQPDGRLAFTTFTEEDDPRWEWQRKPKRDEPTESPLDSRDGLAGVVAAAGFAGPRFVEEDYTLVFADVDEWIAWQWSHGGRRELERKSEAELEAFRRDAAGHLAKLDPIGLTIHARIAVCEASG